MRITYIYLEQFHFYPLSRDFVLRNVVKERALRLVYDDHASSYQQLKRLRCIHCVLKDID